MTRNRISNLPEKSVSYLEEGVNSFSDNEYCFEDYIDKRGQSMRVAQGYLINSWYEERLEEKKRYRNYWFQTNSCGTRLEFKECSSGHERKLERANFCKIRFCPMCAWRKSLKVSKEVHDVCWLLLCDKPVVRFLHLVLTVPSVSGKDLVGEIDRFFYSWKKFLKVTSISEVVLGYFRTLEVTYNIEKDSYHPHFHAILVVPASYFGNSYIHHRQWLDYWRKATKNPDIKDLWIKPLKKSLAAASAEVGKYITKFESMIQKDPKHTAKVLKVLDQSLHSRRTKCFGGIMLKYLKKLDQISKEDRIKLGLLEPGKCSCSVCGMGLVDAVYKWVDDSYVKVEGDLVLRKLG
jgi:plasmid rolling circle replication initiator protein Rep